MSLFAMAPTFRSYLMRLTILILLISALLTTFSILNEQYRIAHHSDSLQLKEPIPVPDSWYSVPAQFMTYISLLLPLAATIGASLGYFRKTEGVHWRRYLRALGLSCMVFPLMCLQYLPWTIYQAARTPGYLQFDEFMFMRALLPVYCAFVVLLSLGVNGVAWFRESKPKMSP